MVKMGKIMANQDQTYEFLGNQYRHLFTYGYPSLRERLVKQGVLKPLSGYYQRSWNHPTFEIDAAGQGAAAYDEFKYYKQLSDYQSFKSDKDPRQQAWRQSPEFVIDEFFD